MNRIFSLLRYLVQREFRDAHQLLTDFFTEVDRVLAEIKTS